MDTIANDTDQEPGALLAAALRYAARGWPVFPCRPGSKAPKTGHGFKHATTDQHTIGTWWRGWPDANVAIATGTMDGTASVDVIDVNVRPTGNGWAAHNRLKRAGLLAGVLAVVRTPSGGLHLYFPGSAQVCGSLPGQHIDFKATGGYVLAPPSTVSGQPYELLDSRTDSAGSQVNWSQIRGLLAPGRPARPVGPFGSVIGGRPSAGLVRVVAHAPEGTRNRMLFWAACRAVTEGHHNVLDDLVDAAMRAGLSEAEARRTVASAQRHTAADGSPA